MATTTTTVITTQPGASSTVFLNKGNNEWTTGLFGCFEDACSCLGAFFCEGIFECFVAQHAGECFLTPLCVPGASIAVRTKVRTFYGIKGSICEDCLLYTFCNPCTMAQIKREIDNRTG
ncbi:Placenta-specific protein8 protein [Holothuria leucospilota]|uniref:Placenta-specific protein8 protein n=1 Tax=Holothuria leucospilota TaxID=206669 RepID=A0A9Q1HH94_HOLLE|nr:Placenta-specific protein8 protein [Holothuria leucospilota]